MTILIDQPDPYNTPPNWCHMGTDGDIDELHEFAKCLGLKLSWFQEHLSVPYYALSPNKQRHALDMGATRVSNKEFFIRCREYRS